MLARVDGAGGRLTGPPEATAPRARYLQDWREAPGASAVPSAAAGATRDRLGTCAPRLSRLCAVAFYLIGDDPKTCNELHLSNGLGTV